MAKDALFVIQQPDTQRFESLCDRFFKIYFPCHIPYHFQKMYKNAKFDQNIMRFKSYENFY